MSCLVLSASTVMRVIHLAKIIVLWYRDSTGTAGVQNTVEETNKRMVEARSSVLIDSVT